MEWLKDSSWNRRHKDKEIYLMVNHKWAFPVWEMANLKKKIKNNALLFHVDSHLDDVPELVMDERYFNISSEQDIIDLIMYEETDENYADTSDWIELEQANFIFPSFLRDTIQDIIYIADDSQTEITTEDIKSADPLENNYNVARRDNTSSNVLSKCHEKIKDKNKSIQRFYSVEDFISSGKSLPSDQPKILDLDLDYFNDSNNFCFSDLKSDEVITSNLKYLKDLCDWDIITVAFSPLYCGGYDECLHIIALFLDVFELNDYDFDEWL